MAAATEERAPGRSLATRDLLLFCAGPALLAVAIAALFAVHPWPVPIRQQAEHMRPQEYAPVLLLAALGVWLSPRAGIAGAPALSDVARWIRLWAASLGLGLVFTAIAAGSDLAFGLEHAAAHAAGAASINVPFPWSIPHYLCGAVLEESLFRLAPIPILTWLIGGLLMRGRGLTVVFWVLAALGALANAVGQGAALAPAGLGLAIGMGTIEFAGNLVWSALYRRFGWPVPLIVRATLELGWHVAWPLMALAPAT